MIYYFTDKYELLNIINSYFLVIMNLLRERIIQIYLVFFLHWLFLREQVIGWTYNFTERVTVLSLNELNEFRVWFVSDS